MFSVYKIRRKVDGLYLAHILFQPTKKRPRDRVVWGPKGRTWHSFQAACAAFRRCFSVKAEEMEIVEFVLQEHATVEGVLVANRVEFFKT